jgi:DNA-binding NarL/FixJ family response regulator
MPSLKNKTRVYIIDDHKIVLEGLESLINREDDMIVCGMSQNGTDILSKIDKSKPEVMVIDIGLQTGMNGIELSKVVRIRYPAVKSIILSQNDEEIYAERAIRAGAMGYVMKSEATKTLVDAIRYVLTGKIYLSETMMSKMLIDVLHRRPDKESPIEALSDRELEIFTLMGKGFKASDIAKKLHISPKTVDAHRNHIKDKFNLKNVSDVVKYAIEWYKAH